MRRFEADQTCTWPQQHDDPALEPSRSCSQRVWNLNEMEKEDQSKENLSPGR